MNKEKSVGKFTDDDELTIEMSNNNRLCEPIQACSSSRELMIEIADVLSLTILSDGPRDEWDSEIDAGKRETQTTWMKVMTEARRSRTSGVPLMQRDASGDNRGFLLHVLL